MSTNLGKSDVNIAYSLYGLGKAYYQLQKITKSTEYLSRAKKLLDSSKHRALGFENINLNVDILPLSAIVLYEKEQNLEEVLSFFNQIMKNMNKLSIEGLYYLIKLITILINQNHVCDNSKKHNYHNTYISTLDYIYNKIQKTKKRIKSEEFQFSYLNNIPINKAIVEEWEKVK